MVIFNLSRKDLEAAAKATINAQLTAQLEENETPGWTIGAVTFAGDPEEELTATVEVSGVLPGQLPQA
jgi:hypothetical protein